LKEATEACELSAWKSPADIESLAGAHAELGDYASAIKYQKQALDLIPKELRTLADSRLTEYVAGRPYRWSREQPVKSTSADESE
jgi:tetratricopeptide (TPR) repeat protein